MRFSSANAFASAKLWNLAAFDLNSGVSIQGDVANAEGSLLLGASEYHKQRLFRLRHTSHLPLMVGCGDSSLVPIRRSSARTCLVLLRLPNTVTSDGA